jgi:1-acyl-sn-glycerol-3-phosphate acyltransferase
MQNVPPASWAASLRSLIFACAYWVLSVFYALLAALLSLLPGRRALQGVIRFYTVRMLWAMRTFAGIKIDLRGREKLPPGSFIIAAKHHSWGDGFVMFANVPNLSFVTGDHLEDIPLLSGILEKLGAIVVDSCGGSEARKDLSDQAARVAAEGKRILIYPEGHLAAPGEKFRYRTGVYYMSRDFNLPVVPCATNLGLFWRQMDFEKRAGTATIEFLDPIPPSDDKDAFMAQLEAVIEQRSNELIAMGRDEPVREARLVEWDEKAKVNVPVSR